MNKNINKYSQIQNANLTGKLLNMKIFNSMKSWLLDTSNDNLTNIQKLTALNNSITLAASIIQNLSAEIQGEERDSIVSIINLLIDKCSKSVSSIDRMEKNYFSEEINSINEIIELIKK